MAGDIRKQLSRRVRELRAKHKMTQQQLAESADIDYKSVQRIEAKNPRFFPKLDTIGRLAKSFNISVSDLLRFR